MTCYTNAVLISPVTKPLIGPSRPSWRLERNIMRIHSGAIPGLMITIQPIYASLFRFVPVVVNMKTSLFLGFIAPHAGVAQW
jgi:hypothetical protein